MEPGWEKGDEQGDQWINLGRHVDKSQSWRCDHWADTTVIWYDFALLPVATICVTLIRGFDAFDQGAWKLKA